MNLEHYPTKAETNCLLPKTKVISRKFVGEHGVGLPSDFGGK